MIDRPDRSRALLAYSVAREDFADDPEEAAVRDEEAAAAMSDAAYLAMVAGIFGPVEPVTDPDTLAAIDRAVSVAEPPPLGTTPPAWAVTRAGHVVALELVTAADPAVRVTGEGWPGWPGWTRVEDVPGFAMPAPAPETPARRAAVVRRADPVPSLF